MDNEYTVEGMIAWAEREGLGRQIVGGVLEAEILGRELREVMNRMVIVTPNGDGSYRVRPKMGDAEPLLNFTLVPLA
jgi:hypothetical protein